MTFKQLATGLYEIPLGIVNVWILESQDGLVLIDSGVPGSAEKIFAAVREIGHQPADIRHILLTHTHPDHFGSLAALQRTTRATTYAHPIDAPYARQGGDFDPADRSRPFAPTPHLIPGLLCRLLIKPYRGIEAAVVDRELSGGETLPFLPDLKVIFTPGHSMGHLAYFWERHGGVLFAGDTCANLPVLDWSLGYENYATGRKTLKQLCELDFQIVTFGHGKAITTNAGNRWRKRWGNL
jgi:glyoxylase-like metal-dependent hydrolase (beta-lactamase superfamily II)